MVRSFLIAAGLAGIAAVAARAAPPEPQLVLQHYATVAEAKYGDALTTAKGLDAAIADLLAAPSQERLNAARAAWIQARVPYMQTEVYRFGNKIVDDWEGKVNSWPLDEGLIDYVDPAYGSESDTNALYTANVIANSTIKINGKDVDASRLTPDFLANTLQGAGGVEANVATGYHAIEFLLWGQDLNGNGPGAGNRPYTDFDLKACTGGHCDRRADYLRSASSLLVQDLQEMVDAWARDGAATKALIADPKAGLTAILTGMGSLSYGELAGERMKLGLLLHDPEEEQDCFSDNTHASHYNDVVGIRAAYTGTYAALDGRTLSGPSVSDLVAARDKTLDMEMRSKLDTTLAAMSAIVKRAETVEHYDQMIAENNKDGNALIQAGIDGLIDQTKSIQRVIAALDLGDVALEGSDSLDNPSAVFK